VIPEPPTFDHRNPPMMSCGHAANSEGTPAGGTRGPACAICSEFVVAPAQPNLEGRAAKCAYDNPRSKKVHTDRQRVPSSLSLAFFSWQPDEEFDEYYCGCYGWD